MWEPAFRRACQKRRCRCVIETACSSLRGGVWVWVCVVEKGHGTQHIYHNVEVSCTEFVYQCLVC